MARVSVIGFLLLSVIAYPQEKTPTEPKRIALVIGNSSYEKLPALPSVSQDVTLISDALRRAGFEIHSVLDFRLPTFFTYDQVEFSKVLSPGSICLVYYAGYTIQGEDDNYLLPVNFDPQNDSELQMRAYHFKRLQQVLDSREAALRIFVLETPPPINGSVQGANGIGLMDPQVSDSKETQIASAVFPGLWAPKPLPDAPDLFTRAVARHMEEPGLSLSEVFDNVVRTVGADSGQKQIVFATSSVVTQKFYFHNPLPESKIGPLWPRPGVPVANRTDREEYVWIEPGKFQMGCVPSDTRCSPAEKPRHEVTISKGFWIGRNEVQVGSYQRFVASDRKKVRMPPGPLWDTRWRVSDFPMVNLRWEEAEGYCEWAGGRLATEAQWEFAARGGKQDEIYPMNTEDSREKANFSGTKGNDIYEYVAPVRKFDPNPYGLYDMAGNVWEWVRDAFSTTYGTSEPAVDPTESDRKEHVIRGGSWDSDPKEHLRLSFRKGYGKSSPSVGFRCVLDDTPQTRKQLPEEGAH